MASVWNWYSWGKKNSVAFPLLILFFLNFFIILGVFVMNSEVSWLLLSSFDPFPALYHLHLQSVYFCGCDWEWVCLFFFFSSFDVSIPFFFPLISIYMCTLSFEERANVHSLEFVCSDCNWISSIFACSKVLHNWINIQARGIEIERRIEWIYYTMWFSSEWAHTHKPIRSVASPFEIENDEWTRVTSFHTKCGGKLNEIKRQK